MPETIVDKVMADWVFSGRLQAMTSAEVEKAIHHATTHPKTSSLATCPNRPNPAAPSHPRPTPSLVSKVEEIALKKRTPTGRPKKEVDPRILLGPGTVRDKAQAARVSPATISRQMRLFK